MIRADREDYSDQERALADARNELAEALAVLEVEARAARKLARAKWRGTRAPDLTRVHAAARAVERCEEACDQAAYDLQTARGEDG